ncbi:GGDEF domain-containing protein [Caballeronia sp. GAWG1-5s-s]|nr:GGDEF domain-containing protein [Caballeronia sp. GAWG1-5s-s]
MKQVAGALAGSLRRRSDFVTRYGGEELVVFRCPLVKRRDCV